MIYAYLWTAATVGTVGVATLARLVDGHRARQLRESDRILAGWREAPPREDLTEPTPTPEVAPVAVELTPIGHRHGYEARHASDEVASTPPDYEPWHYRRRLELPPDPTGEFWLIVDPTRQLSYVEA